MLPGSGPSRKKKTLSATMFPGPMRLLTQMGPSSSTWDINESSPSPTKLVGISRRSIREGPTSADPSGSRGLRVTSRLHDQRPAAIYMHKTHYRILFEEKGVPIDEVQRHADVIKGLVLACSRSERKLHLRYRFSFVRIFIHCVLRHGYPIHMRFVRTSFSVEHEGCPSILLIFKVISARVQQ